MIVYLADEGRAHAIDYRERAPASAHRDMYIRDGKADTKASRRGGLAVGIPGEPAGLELAITQFGSLTLEEVTAPALQLATEGFPVEGHLAKQLEANTEALAADAELAAIFLREDGRPYREGDKLQRLHLADSLQKFAKKGSSPFYAGAIAEDIETAVRARGGTLTRSDLGSYKALQRPPLATGYGDWRLVTMPPPSSGGGTIAQVLSVLEPYDLGELGQNSSTYLHLLAESLKAAFSDRAKFYGDPDFVDVPLARLLSPGHAAAVRTRISSVRALPSAAYGNVDGGSDSGTTHISVVDKDGNAVACTTSVNTAFGSMVGVPNRGIVLNNTMDDFSIQPGVANAFGLVGNEANSVAAAKRPLSSMSPTIVLSKGQVRMVAGASGGPMIITSTLQTLLNVVEFEMSVEDAVTAPRIHHQWMPEMLAVEGGIPEPVRDSLTRRGHRLRPFSAIGSVQAVEVIGSSGGKRTVRAMSDPRKGGVAAAY